MWRIGLSYPESSDSLTSGWARGVYMGRQRYTKVYTGIHEYTRVYKDYKGSKRNQNHLEYKGIRNFPRCYLL